MVNAVNERDLLSQVRHLFVGDDTGLLKKVKLTAKKLEKEYTTSYGMPRKVDVKKRQRTEDGEEEVKIETVTRRPGALGAEDNQRRIRHETEIKFKLLGRYLEQKKDYGVQCASWSLPDSTQYVSLLRGKANVVQVFDQFSGEADSTFDLSEQISTPIRGLHTICDSVSIDRAKHIIVDEAANSYTLDNSSGELEPLFKLKGNHVSKTYMLNSKALSQGSIRNNPQVAKAANLLSVLSKDTSIQIWDIDNQTKESTTPLWSAKNVPNDELDLQVPMYDTSMVQCSSDPIGRVLAVSTAYGEIREYDIRANKRATCNNTIVKTAQMLSNLLQSEVNEHNLYVIT